MYASASLLTADSVRSSDPVSSSYALANCGIFPFRLSTIAFISFFWASVFFCVPFSDNKRVTRLSVLVTSSFVESSAFLFAFTLSSNALFFSVIAFVALLTESISLSVTAFAFFCINAKAARPATTAAIAVAAKAIGFAFIASHKSLIKGITIFVAPEKATMPPVKVPIVTVTAPIACDSKGHSCKTFCAQSLILPPTLYSLSNATLSSEPIAIFKFSIPFCITSFAYSVVFVILAYAFSVAPALLFTFCKVLLYSSVPVFKRIVAAVPAS